LLRSVMVANKSINTAHKAWEGFDVAAMWVELDQLEASAKAARAAKAAKVAETAAAVEAANAAASSAAVEAAQKEEEDTVFAKPGVGDAADADLGSAFAAPDIAAKISDQDRPRFSSEGGRQMSMQYSQQMRPLMTSSSIRRMPSISQRNSLVAIGSGCVPVEDLQHLQTDVDVEVIEEGDEAMH
jgi:hypothetical protein